MSWEYDHYSLRAAVELLAKLANVDECWLDHYDWCRAHGHQSPCPNKEALEFVKRFKERYEIEGND